ncbi:unnamed protein product [Didymodactylos carnosus]|nr:unnamed protein product [Didymodactylos carnosus]CAF3640652.1 unnamed protein product [Didymodactylos carnosus]
MDCLHAADCGRLDIIKQLMTKENSVINMRHKDKSNRSFNVGGTPIHYACRSGHLDVVRYLLEKDPSLIDIKDIENWTPLHYACYNGHLAIVKLLLDKNADTKSQDSYLSKTPLEFAMYKQFRDIIHLLDKNIDETLWKRDFNDIARQGNTPVFRRHSKLFLGRYKLQENDLKCILEFRTDPNHDAIELNNVCDVELNDLSVNIILNHNFR